MATGDDSFVDAYAREVDSRLEADPNPFLEAEPPAAPTGNGTEPETGTAGEVALTLSGSLYDGFSPKSDSDAVGRLTGSLEIAEGAVVLVRSAVCLPDVTLVAEFMSRDDGSSAQIYVCDPFGFNRLGTEGVDEMVEGENSVWIPTGAVYDISITTSSVEPFTASVELFTDADPTIVDLADVSADGVQVTLSGIGDTLVLPLVGDETLTLASSGLAEACNRYLYGAGLLGEGAPWDMGYCGHSSELGTTPTFGDVVPFVVFLRTDDPVQVTLGPAG